MTLFTVRTFFRLVFVSYNLLLFALFFNSTNNSSSLNKWSSDNSFVATNKNNFVKSNFLTCFCVQFFNVDSLTSFNFYLFAASFNDCICAYYAPPMIMWVSPFFVKTRLVPWVRNHLNGNRAVAQVCIVNITILSSLSSYFKEKLSNSPVFPSWRRIFIPESSIRLANLSKS